MHVANLVRDIKAKTGFGLVLQLILMMALLGNILLAIAIVTMDRTVRTIFVPPEITKTFWVDGKKLGPEYLEQMGEWVVYLFATTTPASVDYKTSQILKYVHPSVFGELSIRFKAGSKRLKQENLSRFFLPREVRISESAQAVAFIGVLDSWISDKHLPAEQKAYLVVFDWDGSHTTIKELRETDPKSPFEPMSEQAAAALAVSVEQSAISTLADGEPANPSPTQSAPTSLPPAPPASSPAAQSALEVGQLPKEKP